MDTDIILDGPNDAPMTVALAHGAGAPMDSPFLSAVAAGLADRGLRAARFEFPYMAAWRRDGRRRPPDRQAVLLDAWRAVIARLETARLVIGGKSMGARMASLVADESAVAGLVCLGYPFHPPGRPERIRTEHLETVRTPTLIVQGTRDPFGTPDEVAACRLSAAVHVHWIEDGNHDLAPRKASGRSAREALDEAIGAMADFVAAR